MSGRGHAARVALVATLLVGVVYAGCVVALNRAITGRLVSAVDSRLREQLATVQAGHRPARDGTLVTDTDNDIDEAPVFVWRAVPGHRPVPISDGAPVLPSGFVPAGGGPVTIQLGASPFRLATARQGPGLLVAGQSLAEQQHVTDVLQDGEVAVAPVLLLAMFAGSLIIGLRALSPVEQSRRRQLEFTADASHELRTPLSVISAEIGIALSTPRPAGDYQATLHRIDRESQRLRRIVEDLLWLARFDSQPPPPGAEPVDLSVIAAECAERFQAVGHAASPGISVDVSPSPAAWISAPPEWVDRLTGVLVDNACRYAGPGGHVRLGVAARGNRVSLTVEDSGPGIPAADRPRLFDRFHRATDQGSGAGLGLAIADSIARSTGGHWRIGESGLGGALFEVSWRRSPARGHGGGQAAPPSAAPAAQPSGAPAAQPATGPSGAPAAQPATGPSGSSAR
ncbi:MAG TPA: HAMP domain-containing sensor histidine kinase [Streptosporangiaceae bacterium]|nr:HAMP domain-containing sensor histidine kinase [Streptosporangiaceae bacterium]